MPKTLVKGSTVVSKSGKDLDLIPTLVVLRVLIIDNDYAAIKRIKDILLVYGYDVTKATDFREGPLKIDAIEPDIILYGMVDESSKGISGRTFLKEMYIQRPHVPIIVYSDNRDIDSVVDVLNSGADDYVYEPFEPEEMMARMNAVLRRTGVNRRVMFNEAGLSVNYVNKEVMYNGKVVDLTKKRYDLLAALARVAPKIAIYEYISQLLWGKVLPNNQLKIKYLVHMIRQSLIKVGAPPELIKNEEGKGYRLEIE
mgnify:CR=1 FL=1